MREILVFRLTPDDGPGFFGQFLGKKRVAYREVRVDRGERVPDRLGSTPALVFMGGPQSANDPLPWVPSVLRLIREAADRDVPVLGHCLGGQLMSRALGGTVGPSPVREIGWLPVRKAVGPVAEDWLDGLEEELVVFQWHLETFSLPPGSIRVLEGDGCPNQAFVLGRSLGLQCHIEMLAEMVEDWVSDPGDVLSVRSPTVQTAAEMLDRLEDRIAGLNRVAEVLYSRWLQGVR